MSTAEAPIELITRPKRADARRNYEQVLLEDGIGSGRLPGWLLAGRERQAGRQGPGTYDRRIG